MTRNGQFKWVKIERCSVNILDARLGGLEYIRTRAHRLVTFPSDIPVPNTLELVKLAVHRVARGTLIHGGCQTVCGLYCGWGTHAQVASRPQTHKPVPGCTLPNQTSISTSPSSQAGTLFLVKLKSLKSHGFDWTQNSIFYYIISTICLPQYFIFVCLLITSIYRPKTHHQFNDIRKLIAKISRASNQRQNMNLVTSQDEYKLSRCRN